MVSVMNLPASKVTGTGCGMVAVVAAIWLTPSKEERGSGDWGGDLVIYSTQAHVHPCRVLYSIASVATVT